MWWVYQGPWLAASASLPGRLSSVGIAREYTAYGTGGTPHELLSEGVVAELDGRDREVGNGDVLGAPGAVHLLPPRGGAAGDGQHRLARSQRTRPSRSMKP